MYIDNESQSSTCFRQNLNIECNVESVYEFDFVHNLKNAYQKIAVEQHEMT